MKIKMNWKKSLIQSKYYYFYTEHTCSIDIFNPQNMLSTNKNIQNSNFSIGVKSLGQRG